MIEQADLCRTWSDPQIVVFLVGKVICTEKADEQGGGLAPNQEVMGSTPVGVSCCVLTCVLNYKQIQLPTKLLEVFMIIASLIYAAVLGSHQSFRLFNIAFVKICVLIL